MAYRVEITSLAEGDAREAFERLWADDPESAQRWLAGLFAALYSLADMPARCPVIPEAGELGRPVRHLLYGKRPRILRILFDIDPDAPGGGRVRILRLWPGSRSSVRPEDFRTSPDEARGEEDD